MSIKEELRSELKSAMLSKDTDRLDVIRQIETEVSFVKSAPGFSGEVTDETYLSVIKSYSKKMSKAIEEYRSHDREGVREMIVKLQFEVDYLSRWIPKKLGEEEIRKLVKEAISDIGSQSSGKVIGYIMKNFKDKEKLDGSLIKKVVEQIFNERD